MPIESNDSTYINRVEAELCLVSMLDSHMIGLLKSIDQYGSINLAPKVLISTATFDSNGGTTCLTATGQGLLKLLLN
jgi:molybdate transport system regulatory protein